MRKYSINPYVGVGDLKFGMMREEAIGILGPPELTFKESDGSGVFCWANNGLQLMFSAEDETLVLISLYPGMENIDIDGAGFSWDNSQDIYKRLVKDDPSAKETVGISIFFRYGISSSGPLDEENDQKSLTAFAKGQWREG